MSSSPSKQHITEFSEPLLTWFDEFGRHDLPWQQNINPYRVWVSEIMLQQTQVATVIPYYQRFMERFPSVKELARASQEEVLSYWAGLGYYARGRNLHKAAQQIMQLHHGVFPAQFDDILALPGIGRSTAGAISSIALQQRYAILDGNVKRVLTRYFAMPGWPGEKKIEQKLWELADQLTPQQRFNDYTQAIMDLGATLCKRSKPQCSQCPVKQHCQAFKQDEVSLYPYSKPKKIKPVKQAWMLLEHNTNGDILLYKRPQQGIWAGLWSLPEFESHEDCLQYLQSKRRSVKSLIEWSQFRHTFSHYHLDIYPQVFLHELSVENGQQVPTNDKLQVAEMTGDYQAQQMQWINLQAVLDGDFGIPAPVSKLLKQLKAEIEN